MQNEMESPVQRARWEARFESLVFVFEALRLHVEDPDLARLADRVLGVLQDWEAIEGDRRRLRHATLLARVHIQSADAALDQRIHEFAASLLQQTGGSENHELYTRFFPEHHDTVIELGLDAETPVAMLIAAMLEEQSDLPETLKEHLAPLRRALQAGNSALAERADALGNLGRHQARVEAWLESAECTVKTVRRGIESLAKQRGFGGHWVRAFFPPQETV
jgi:hypothetical protein